jgi:hypothetical protein
MRVPFQNLIECLLGGDELAQRFPSVKREQTQAALGVPRETLET